MGDSPTLDVNASIASLGQTIARLSAASHDDQPKQVINNTNVYYTQNNTSPEALDAATIYRETNSLLRRTYPAASVR